MPNVIVNATRAVVGDGGNSVLEWATVHDDDGVDAAMAAITGRARFIGGDWSKVSALLQQGNGESP